MTINSDTKSLIEYMLNELENPTKRLTTWEMQFIESIKDQWINIRSLSERQFEILERIYTEKMA